MKTSTDRILTTHVGSIPRPGEIREVIRARLEGHPVPDEEINARTRSAVKDVVAKQAESGLDVINDGEYGKTSFLSYAEDRLTGFERLSQEDPRAPAEASGAEWSRRIATRREWTNFREYYEAYLPVGMPVSAPLTICTGPISYKGQLDLHRDLDNLRSALQGVSYVEAFVPAIAPSMVGRGQNRYYNTEEEYRQAIAEAMHEEYKAIVDAGFVLQIDDPGLGETWDMTSTKPDMEEYRRVQSGYIDMLNHALEGIPEDRVRYHLCWGSWQGPHVGDLSLRDVIDLVLRVRAQAYVIESATPRHSWEWRLWKDVKLPDDKVLVPGLVAHTTAVVEHPETIAERLLNYASVVGRERVMAGADCGFAQGSLYQRQHPTVMWAKFQALAEGARLASQQLWR